MRIYFFCLLLIFYFVSTSRYEIIMKSIQEGGEKQQWGDCFPEIYGKEGDDCVPGWNSTRTCKNFLSCINGKCKKSHVGSYCENDSDCYGANFGGTKCVDKRCIRPRYNGYGCYNDNHCWSGKCQGGRCFGAALGQPCDPLKLSCEDGSYCSAALSMCQKQKSVGEYCSDYADDGYQGSNWNVICRGGMKCGGAVGNEYCYFWKRGLKGAPCNHDDACRFGLTCSRRNGMCVDVGDFIPTYRCSGSRNCSYDNEELCVCSNGRGSPGKCERVFSLYSKECDFNGASNRYRQCVERNNCAFEPSPLTAMELNALDPETCIGKHCSSEVLNSVCCGYSGYSQFTYTPANMPPYCGSNPGLAVFLVLFFLCVGSIFMIIVFAIVGGLSFYFIRKRAHNPDAVFATDKETFETLE